MKPEKFRWLKLLRVRLPRIVLVAISSQLCKLTGHPIGVTRETKGVTQTVLDAALALPSAERAELAERLWESLPDEKLDAAFAEELAREIRSRRERYLRGESQLHDWSNVREELNAIIDGADQA